MECGRLDISLRDAIDLSRAFGPEFGEAIHHHLRAASIRADDPADKWEPGYSPPSDEDLRALGTVGVDSFEAIHLLVAAQADLAEQPAPDISRMSFPLGELLHPVLGSEIPGDHRYLSPRLAQENRERIEGWIEKESRRYGISRAGTSGFRITPAVQRGGISTLVAPSPSCWVPILPRVSTRFRGPTMIRRRARLVLDPRSLDFTVVTRPLAALHPLRVLTVSKSVPVDEGVTVEDRHCSVILRVAGVMASTPVQ
jgi:hypothetical protein